VLFPLSVQLTPFYFDILVEKTNPENLKQNFSPCISSLHSTLITPESLALGQGSQDDQEDDYRENYRAIVDT
jgi:hypothetical protein